MCFNRAIILCFISISGTGTPLGWSVANVIVFNKIRKLLGLDQCHFPMTGSAPISQDTLAYFMSVNIPIYELYGMSECCGCCTVTTGDVIRFKSSGVPLSGIEVRISDTPNADNGEVRNQCIHIIGSSRLGVESVCINKSAMYMLTIK